MTDSTKKARFELLAMPHMDAAYNLARWLTGNTHDAEDITQEAFMRAFRFFDGFRGEDPRTWLLKIVRNTYYTYVRRQRGEGGSTEFDEELHSLPEGDAAEAMARVDANPESIFARAEDVKVLDKAIAELPVEYREALVLRELEDLSYREIALALEVPIGTVMSRLARARRLVLDNFNRRSGGNDGLQRNDGAVRRIR